jgi:hypothetical protein
MAILNENELITILKKAKKVLLLEPPYVRHYIPLGLAKIASFVKSNGGEAIYSRKGIPEKFDLICIATCFTTDSKIVIREIKECQRSLFNRKTRIIAGGIFASLMPDYLIKKTNIDIFVGCSDILDNCLPDYSLNYEIGGFFENAMILFTTRGCPNKCSYCMVWRLEKEHKIIPSWEENIRKSDRRNCIILDNNFLSFSIDHVKKVIDCLNIHKKRVLFNNGVDCRLIDEKNAKLLASLFYIRNGFRIAFDRMEDDGYYQRAMEKMIKAGLKIKGNSYTYVLFNFNDTPQEAYYRAKECWKYGSNPYLMRYRPLNQLKKIPPYVSKYWTKNLITAFSDYGQKFGYSRGDTTFESWVKNGKIKLNDEDWEKWYYKR